MYHILSHQIKQKRGKMESEDWKRKIILFINEIKGKKKKIKERKKKKREKSLHLTHNNRAHHIMILMFQHMTMDHIVPHQIKHYRHPCSSTRRALRSIFQPSFSRKRGGDHSSIEVFSITNSVFDLVKVHGVCGVTVVNEFPYDHWGEMFGVRKWTVFFWRQ